MKGITVLIIMLLLIPVIFGEETTKVCIDANTLKITTNKTISTSNNITEIEVIEEKHCPAGCASGECKPIQSSMPIELYMFLCGVGIVTMFTSFLKSDILLFKWICVIIFFMLGISSFNLNRIYCEYGSSWECYTHVYKATPLAYLWLGLGLIMLVYAIISSIQQPFEQVVKTIER